MYYLIYARYAWLKSTEVDRKLSIDFGCLGGTLAAPCDAQGVLSIVVQPGGRHQPKLFGGWGCLTHQLQSKPQHCSVLLQCALMVFSFYIGMLLLEGENNPGVARERVWNLQGLWSRGVWGVATPRPLWVRRSLPGSLVCAWLSWSFCLISSWTCSEGLLSVVCYIFTTTVWGWFFPFASLDKEKSRGTLITKT